MISAIRARIRAAFVVSSDRSSTSSTSLITISSAILKSLLGRWCVRRYRVPPTECVSPAGLRPGGAGIPPFGDSQKEVAHMPQQAARTRARITLNTDGQRPPPAQSLAGAGNLFWMTRFVLGFLVEGPLFSPLYVRL